MKSKQKIYTKCAAHMHMGSQTGPTVHVPQRLLCRIRGRQGETETVERRPHKPGHHQAPCHHTANKAGGRNLIIGILMVKSGAPYPEIPVLQLRHPLGLRDAGLMRTEEPEQEVMPSLGGREGAKVLGGMPDCN